MLTFALGIAIGNFANQMNALYVQQRDSLVFADEALKEGPVTVHNDGRTTVYQVRGGFADVAPDGFTVLAEHAVEAG